MDLSKLSLQELDILYKHSKRLCDTYWECLKESEDEPDDEEGTKRYTIIWTRLDRVLYHIDGEITKRLFVIYDQTVNEEEYVPYFDESLFKKKDNPEIVPDVEKLKEFINS